MFTMNETNFVFHWLWMHLLVHYMISLWTYYLQSPPPGNNITHDKTPKPASTPASYHIFPKYWVHIEMTHQVTTDLTSNQITSSWNPVCPSVRTDREAAASGECCGGDAPLGPRFSTSPAAGFLPARIYTDTANHKMPQAEVTCRERVVRYLQPIKPPMAAQVTLRESTSSSAKRRGSHHRDHTGRRWRRLEIVKTKANKFSGMGGLQHRPCPAATVVSRTPALPSCLLCQDGALSLQKIPLWAGGTSVLH